MITLSCREGVTVSFPAGSVVAEDGDIAFALKIHVTRECGPCGPFSVRGCIVS